MNVLNDFTIRVKNDSGHNFNNKKFDDLLKLIEEKDQIINQYRYELAKEKIVSEGKIAANPPGPKKKRVSASVKLSEKKEVEK